MLSASEAARSTRLPSLPALDGLRAVAVAAVLLYHADVSWIPGGFLGVEVFFVLSGYLITALLWSEWRAAGAIVLRGFWVRRARRLLPALFTMLILLAAAIVVWWPQEAIRVRGEAAAGGGYVSNWYLIAHDQSYFQEMGRPSPLRHLWSLAIEMQFYLIWPLALAGIARALKRPNRIAGATLGLAALSAALMWLLIEPGADPSRAYYGTDTRAAGLLLGAALALVWRPFDRVVRVQVSERTLARVTVVGLAAIGASFLFLDEFSASTYRPGIQLVALATAVVVAAAVHPANTLARRVLGWRWLRAAGRRSYSIYLWHWPVFVLMRPELDLPWSSGPSLLPRLAVALVLAEASYRYVEMPLRTGVIGRTMKSVIARARRASADRRRQIATSWMGAATVPVLLLTLLAIGLVRAAPPGQAAVGPETVIAERPARELRSTERQPHRDIQMLQEVTTSLASPGARQLRPSLPPLPPLNRSRVLAVGDSVMAGARYALNQLIPRVLVDAATSRHVHEGVALLERWARKDRLPDEVVVHLGNNGVFIPDQFSAMMRTLRDVERVVVVGVHVPRRWQGQVNDTLRALAPRYDNVALVDWDRVSDTCPGPVFASDGLHLTSRGATCYARAIAGALLN